ncbi:ribosome-associated protein [Arthrobacter sp. AG1021]|nr:ribosome-associated protein [Arthrobacter sp. AG1021]
MEHMSASEAFELEIRDESIRLGQLLKLANLAEDGIHAKELISEGEVTVNGQVETRRGAQIRQDDVVCVNGECVKVSSRA